MLTRSARSRPIHHSSRRIRWLQHSRLVQYYRPRVPTPLQHQHLLYAAALAGFLLLGSGSSIITITASGFSPRSREPAASLQQPAASMASASSSFGDFRTDRPGVVHKISLADLPPPFATKAVDNGPTMARRPAGALPTAPPGYSVTVYADTLEGPRLIRTAPNGDLFVAESDRGRIKILRGLGPEGRAQTVATFATGLRWPFGIAFYPPGPNPQYVYVGNTDSVVRFPYQTGDLKARGREATIVPSLPGGGRLRGGGHWTRDVVFSRDGSKMFVGVGSLTNVDDPDSNLAEKERGDILEFNPDGRARRIYAWGIRNPVGLAVHPPDRPAVGVGQRARQSGGRPRARLHHARRRGGVLRLALVLHGRPSGSAACREASRAEVEGRHT